MRWPDRGRLAVKAEVDVLRALHRSQRSWALHRALAKVTSPRIGEDLMSGVLMASIAALWKVGYRLFWAYLLASVLGAASLASYRGPRPAQADIRLQSHFRASGNAAVSGLVLFATVLFGELGMLADSWTQSAVCVAALSLCAYSRLLAMAHFPHQVLFSSFLGFLAIALERGFATRLPLLSAGHRLAAAYFAGMIALVLLLARFESDDPSVRPFNLAKYEYKRVLYNIMDGDASLDEPSSKGTRGMKAPHAPPAQDSFVKLVRSLERRSMANGTGGESYAERSSTSTMSLQP